MRHTEGYSLVEAVLVISVFTIIAAVAVPSLMRARARVDVAAARRAFVSTHNLARRVAAQYGSLARLHIDPKEHRFWVTVDTSAGPGHPVEDTVGPVTHVAAQFGGVKLSSNRRLICYHPFGLGTAQGSCELPNATLVFARSDVVDTVTVSRLGRVRRR
jgi:Tfp pilus assembly protein FimT